MLYDHFTVVNLGFAVKEEPVPDLIVDEICSFPKLKKVPKQVKEMKKEEINEPKKEKINKRKKEKLNELKKGKTNNKKKKGQKKSDLKNSSNVSALSPPPMSVSGDGVQLIRVIQCPVCLLCFKDLKHYDAHDGRHHTHACTQCSLEFVQKSNLQIHLLRDHKETKVKVKICQICENPVELKSLVSHQRSLHNNPCEHCTLKCTSLPGLFDHQISKHPELFVKTTPGGVILNPSPPQLQVN